MKAIIFLLIFFNSLFSFDFNLKPIKLNENSYYFYGKEDYFSMINGGNISNSAFIITKNSVILIDTGSSYKYGKQVIEAIKKITNKPIKYIINTHHHPDHFLGNNAFKDVNIYATQYTIDEIAKNGKLYITNMYNLLGEIEKNTETKVPNKTLNKQILSLDDYKLELYYLHGHTKSDLVIYDRNTNILYSSDLVFNHRALATPHANLKEWIDSLKFLKLIPYDICIPGHGLVFRDKKPIEQNILYLETLEKNLTYGIKNGLDIFEILSLDVPKDIQRFSIFKEEYERSIINLYNRYEQKLEK